MLTGFVPRIKNIRRRKGGGAVAMSAAGGLAAVAEANGCTRPGTNILDGKLIAQVCAYTSLPPLPCGVCTRPISSRRLPASLLRLLRCVSPPSTPRKDTAVRREPLSFPRSDLEPHRPPSQLSMGGLLSLLP